MAISDSQQRHHVGYQLVLLALSGPLGGWTLLHNRPGNFNSHLEPKASGLLVTSGPYRLMRHPM